MTDSNIPSTRSFSRADAKRVFITLAMLGVLGVGSWFLLPAIQSLIIPNAPGGNNEPWVVRPILAFHFGAVAVMAAVTLPLLSRPLQQLWKRRIQLRRRAYLRRITSDTRNEQQSIYEKRAAFKRAADK